MARNFPVIEVGNVRFCIAVEDENGKLSLLPEAYTESEPCMTALMTLCEAEPTKGFQMLQLHTGPWLVVRRVADEQAEEMRRKTGIPDRLFTPTGVVELPTMSVPAPGRGTIES